MRILGRKSVIIADLERYESREQRLNALLRPQITEAGPKTPSRRPGGNRVAAPGCAASYRRNAETRASADPRRVMKADPDDAAAAFNLGNLLRSTGRAVEVEAAFRAAIRIDRRFAKAWFNLADLLEEQGRIEEAIACLKSALSINPEYADAMFNLALLLQARQIRRRDGILPALPYQGHGFVLGNGSPKDSCAMPASSRCSSASLGTRAGSSAAVPATGSR